MRYFLTIGYDGTAYHGWQRQPNGDSVQARLERALSLLLSAPTEVVGAGRTDAGVHATAMVAHFDAPALREDFGQRLGRMLPPDIVVRGLQPVPAQAHARFSATARSYRYVLLRRPDPFLRRLSMQWTGSLDRELMNQAAALLLHVEDFTSFSKLHTDTKTNICHVSRAQWCEKREGVWCFEITADRFLRNMVRAVVGTLIEVGRHRLSIAEFQRVIAAHDRCQAGQSVPACGLFLTDVRYPDWVYAQGSVPV